MIWLTNLISHAKIEIMVTKKDLQDAIDEATADIISAVTKGFETLATKEELKTLATKEELVGEIGSLKSELKADINDIKRQINDLKADLPTPQEVGNQDKRISKLEKAVFSA